jgi:hypothetical protein
MIKQRRETLHSPVVLLALFVSTTACARAIEIPIESPMRSRIDMRAFNRVLVGGFITEPGGVEIDLEGETVRLLQNQLQTQSRLRVFTVDHSPLQAEVERLSEQTGERAEDQDERERRSAEYDAILGDAVFWRKIGEEYQQPLIIAGKIGFTAHNRPGFSADERVTRDAFGIPRLVRSNRYTDRKGFSLTAQFNFIDGRSGQALHKEKFTEEVYYGEDQKVAPLSSYFELMDRLLPNVLGVISTRKIRSTRVLLE